MALRTPELFTPSLLDWASVASDKWDAVIVVGPTFENLPEAYQTAIARAQQADLAVTEQTNIVFCEEAPGKRLILAPTGSLEADYDDIRRFFDAAHKAGKRAALAGSKKPVLVVTSVPAGEAWQHALSSCYLGLMQGAYEPLEAREHLGEDIEPFTAVGLLDEAKQADAHWLAAVEAGKRVARDICGTEPERMSPVKAGEYCQQAFAGTGAQVTIINDRLQLQHEYPLLSTVARATFAIDKQRPCVVRIEYKGEGPIEQNLFLVGKGVTYDTGGADIKTGGHMAGMSRDKGGAAAVAGFLRTVAALQPKGVRVVAELAFVRNNIDSLAFVADEIVTARSGVRVRIGNTDAEGRLAIVDALCKLKEEALQTENAALFTIATLTGHAALAKGPYTAAVPNGVALSNGLAQQFVDAGELWGDMAEVSISRREDFDFIRPRTKADDVLSSNNGPSATTVRGHQFPMAFLVRASGLEQHGKNSEQPLAYLHLDIAGSGVEGGDWQHGKPTAAPVVALAGAFLAGR